MSIVVNGNFFADTYQQMNPSWYRLERYGYCETLKESALSVKRSLFGRRAGKKRSK